MSARVTAKTVYTNGLRVLIFDVIISKTKLHHTWREVVDKRCDGSIKGQVMLHAAGKEASASCKRTWDLTMLPTNEAPGPCRNAIPKSYIVDDCAFAPLECYEQYLAISFT